MVFTHPRLGAPGSSVATGAELDGELRRILASLYQVAAEAVVSVAVFTDLSFLESMAAGIKEMQGRHSLKWQALKE